MQGSSRKTRTFQISGIVVIGSSRTTMVRAGSLPIKLSRSFLGVIVGGGLFGLQM